MTNRIFTTDVQMWQEKLADRLRRGSVQDVKSELRQSLYHVVASYSRSDGTEDWESCAKFSRRELADDAVSAVKRLAMLDPAEKN